MHASEPPEYATPEDDRSTDQPTDQPAVTSDYGVDPAQALVEIAGDGGIERANIHAFAHGLFAAAFEHCGGFRADDVFTRRFVRGKLPIAPGDLKRQTCEHIERERGRFPHDDRNRVLQHLFDDPKLDGHIARLADACIALDLSGCSGCTGAPLPEVVARPMVRRRIEDLQRYASDRGAGGVGLVVKEATDQVIEVTNILDHEDICAYLSGRDVFERIVGLTPEERPTAEEARQTMALGSVARRLFGRLASEAGRLDSISDGELATICGLAMEFQFARGSIGTDVGEVAGRGRRAADDAADEHGRKVIYFRGSRFE
jgi:hypothetical protein